MDQAGPAFNAVCIYKTLSCCIKKGGEGALYLAQCLWWHAVNFRFRVIVVALKCLWLSITITAMQWLFTTTCMASGFQALAFICPWQATLYCAFQFSSPAVPRNAWSTLQPLQQESLPWNSRITRSGLLLVLQVGCQFANRKATDKMRRSNYSRALH